MPLIDSWDSGQPGAFWDSGLQFDTDLGPALGDISPYLALITSEHRDKVKFVATYSFLVQALADTIATLQDMPDAFDIDTAVGAQLDVLGLWIGATRNLTIPITGVYFSWGIEGVGWGQGTWLGPFDSETALLVLSDGAFRTLLKAKVASNNWDGTLPGATEIWAQAFGASGYRIVIQDFCNMHILIALLGPVPDAVTLALLTGGALDTKPAGVAVDGYLVPTVDSAPYFGWGLDNDAVAGWGTGAWGKSLPPT